MRVDWVCTVFVSAAFCPFGQVVVPSRITHVLEGLMKAYVLPIGSRIAATQQSYTFVAPFMTSLFVAAFSIAPAIALPLTWSA